MLVVTAEEMRELDRLTIEQFGVPSLTLMERAGEAIAAAIVKRFSAIAKRGVLIVAGKGNNGGDGFVVARLLKKKRIPCEVVLLARQDELSPDATHNLRAFLKLKGKVSEITAGNVELLSQRLSKNGLLVDAILGTGMKNDVRGLFAEAIALMNASGLPIVAVDIPSGLDTDKGTPLGVAIQAEMTVALGYPKLGEVIFPGLDHVGDLVVADIGINQRAVAQVAPRGELLEREPISWLVPRRAADSHKGSYGHLLIVAGSRGKTGAAALGGKAALRMGAGLVTVATPAGGQPVVASMVPEIMTESLPETDTGAISGRALDYGRFAKLLEGKTVLAMGPGLTTHPETAQFVRAVLEQFDLPLVLDADALNALVGQLDALRARRSRRVILTPHPGEMARLLGTTSAEVQRRRIEVAQKFARDFDVFVILKGHRSLVAAPDGQVWVSPTGNPGMASGGTGDVLTGMVAGALAQFPQVPPGEAACLAVFLHGLAGDLAAGIQGEQGMIASDVVEALPAAWRRLRERIDSDDPERYYLVP